jgi:hypothetical protein
MHAAGADFLDLPSGKGLSLEDAKEITRSRFTRVVLFAGTVKSGKTTLLASLYLLFQRGAFADYLFAGSRTLVGFETRTYLARTASKRETPTTPRTVVSEHLHLLVRKKDLSEPAQDLLLCDLSGEDFREAKDSSDACRRMGLIRRADIFVLLIDGEKLTVPETRRRAKNDPSTLLRNCLDNSMLSESSTVDVMFTKWDIMESRDDKDAIVTFVQSIEEEFTRQFSPRLRRLRISRVAAQPFEAQLPPGYGLTDVFPYWVKPEHQFRIERTRLAVQPTSEYDRFNHQCLPRPTTVREGKK